MTLRAGSAGDGWTCVAAAVGALCQRPTLLAGKTSRAYVPVDVAADAADGAPTVTISAPNLITRTALSTAVVSSSGLAATMAGTMAANVTVVGNSLLSCPHWAFRCASARAGTGGATDNGDYAMTEYADPMAPVGAPLLGAVSGATLALPGKVLWAGLYWAGTGSRPATPAAYLRGPASSSYTKVRASRVDTVTASRFSQPAYQASADVTALVRANRGGQWWLAVDRNVFDHGAGTFGGWSLVVLVADGVRRAAWRSSTGSRRCRAPSRSRRRCSARQARRRRWASWAGRATEGFAATGSSSVRCRSAGLIATTSRRAGPAAPRLAGTRSEWTRGYSPEPCRLGVKSQTVTANTNGDAWLLGVIALVTPER